MAQDHFKRHDHYAGVVDWNFNVVYNKQPSIVAMAEAYKPILARPELYNPIPSEWLHATIMRVGKFDEFTEEEMISVAKKVQSMVAKVTLPEFHFGKFVNIHGNICFRVEPEPALEILYNIVVESLDDVVGAKRTPQPPYGHFIAHTSLAYTKAQDNEDEINAAVEAANITSAKFRITNMPLIKQWPTNGHYEWQIVKDIKLG